MAGYEVRNDGIEEELRRLGRYIGTDLPKGWGFTLMLFDYGNEEVKNGGMFYISSAKREDMIKAMKEFIAKQEAEKQ